jgi:hypothetical protein
MAENYQQHAEHYVRIINAMNEAYGQPPHQQPSPDGNREQPGVDADYDPLTSPAPQRREYEARSEGGDRPQQQRREFEPRGDNGQQRRDFESRSDNGERQPRREYEARGENGDRQQQPRRDFEPRSENGERPPRREFEPRNEGGDRPPREQNYRDRDGRPPRDRDQNARDPNREQQGQPRGERFGGQRDGRPDYRNDRQQPSPRDLNAPQPHVPGPLESPPLEDAASASFGADPRDQEDTSTVGNSVDMELALPASIVARPRRGRPPRAAAPADVAAPSAEAPAPVAAVVAPEPAPAPVAPAEASAQPALPGVTVGEEAPAAPKRRPGRPRKVKPVEGSEPSGE